jgi:hypothetical protein
MTQKISKAAASLVAYPFTWAVIAVLAAANMAFFTWFPPTFLFSSLMAGIDIVMLGAWVVIVFRSGPFRDAFNRMPNEKRNRELSRLIRSIPDTYRFRGPAEECVSLIDRINGEFHDAAYADELALLQSNIYSLAQNHLKLLDRAAAFGTEAQKGEMRSFLKQQVASLNGILDTLKTFSGNLTLLSANAGNAVHTATALKDINEGFREILSTQTMH